MNSTQPDDSGRIPPPRDNASSSSSSPRKIFPRFLGGEQEDEAESSYRRSTSPSSFESDSVLAYLRPVDDASPQASSSRKAPPAPLALEQSASGSGSSSGGGRGSGMLSALGTGKVERPLSSGRRRPSPLQLDKTKAIGLDEELQQQRDLDGPVSAISVVTTSSPDSLHSQMQDLSLLRRSVRQNLMDRPVDSPLGGSESGGSSGALTPELLPPATNIPEEHLIDISQVVELLSASSTRTPPQTLVLDTRPLGLFLDSHLPRSANVSIPSLIFKRFRKATSAANATSWNSLASFVSTPAGKDVWDGINPKERVDVVVVGLTAMDETAKVLRGIMAGLVTGDVKVLKGGWASVVSDQAAQEILVAGEQSVKPVQPQASTSSAGSLPPPKTPGLHIIPPPIPPSVSPPRIAHHPSMPSLRTEALSNTRRNLPFLSVHTNQNSSRRPPKLSLNLDKPLKSATFGSFRDEHSPSDTLGVPGQSRKNPGLTISAPKSPLHTTSFQTLCHEQSKLPPSPRSFGGVGSMGEEEDLASPETPWTSHSTAKPNGRNVYPSPATPLEGYQGSMTARSGGIAPFIVSTILPHFLYLGPEITTVEEVEILKKIGIKRILNVAIECNDDDQIRLKDNFERYYRLPMRDIVEESGVAKGMRDACKFLDDARLHSAPTYVHCKAGKSRSVTVVLAYLIHANAWTLKTSYAYVAERRKGISPNIGFVAELMQFEEAELGLKQSGGVHGESSRGDDSDSHDDADDATNGKKGQKSKQAPRHMRDSLPPAWAASLDSGPRPSKVPLHGEEEKDDKEDRRKNMGDEREVRKNGQWVHQRRAPVDRTTLQPGRRVSKAGLESLRPLATANASKTSPRPSPGLTNGGEKPTTPAVDSRVGWV